MRAYRALDPQRLPPWLLRFVRTAGRGIHSLGMLVEGDSVLIGVSGGKDSLALALALAFRLRWLPIRYSLSAAQIDWKEHPLDEGQKAELDEYFDFLGIPYRRIAAEMAPANFQGRFDCYLCSRNRKRILFEEAGRTGCGKIALGHHMDDIIETTLINACFRGNFSTMLPVQDFFGGKLQIVRPLCLVKESAVNTLATRLELPVVSLDCPYKEKNLRRLVKPIVRELCRIDPKAREHLYEAPWNVIEKYLPAYRLKRKEKSESSRRGAEARREEE